MVHARACLRPISTAVKRTSPKRKLPDFEAGRFISTNGSDLTARQIAFGKAMDVFKREPGHAHPSDAQILDVLISLGYRLPNVVSEVLDEFTKALNEYKRTHRSQFPTYSEVLDIADGLGLVLVGENQAVA